MSIELEFGVKAYGMWDVQVDGEELSRKDCPHRDLRHCEHNANPDGFGVFGHENCVYSNCPINIEDSYEKV